MLLAIAATALGGSSVQINNTLHDGPAIGLDWFLLDMFLMALIYVPLERLCRSIQNRTFRNEWTWMWFISCPLICRCKFYFLVLLPATQATKYLVFPVLQHSSLECPGRCNFSWLLWLRTWLSILFIWLCIKCLFCGAFMPCIILRSAGLDRGFTLPFYGRHIVRGFVLAPLMLGFRNRSS